MIKVCDKYGGKLPEKETEELWLFAIDGLYNINKRVCKREKQLKRDDKGNLKAFLMIRT